MPQGTIKATVLIETILAAFEMDEILYELREHSAGLNAGRWDYIFSVIKKLGHRPEFVLPDRARRDDGRAVHARLHGAARQDLPPARRARDGRDGGVHPVAARPGGQREGTDQSARRQGKGGGPGFRRHLGRPPRPRSRRDRDLRRACSAKRRTSVERQRDDVVVDRGRTARRRRDPGRDHGGGPRATTSRSGSSTSPPGCSGSGAVAIFNLMEDAATSEISRSPGLAVAPARPGLAGGRRAGDRGGGRRSSTATTPRRGRSSSRWRSATSSSSS